MAAPSVHVMPEHWSQLIAARKQRQLCDQDVQALKLACEQSCGKKHVAECTACYEKVLQRMRKRYHVEADTGAEWFTERKAFLNELDGLFADAQQRKISLKAVESRIESEKEAWYRWVLRKYPEFLAVSDNQARQEELRSMLDDPDRPRDELLRLICEGIGMPAEWSTGVDRFSEAVAATGGDVAELKKLYVAEFFMTQPAGEVVAYAKRYLDEYEQAGEAASIEDVVDKIVLEIRESRNTLGQREKHTRRLDELRRAKTAFEQNRLRAKGLAAGGQRPSAGSDLYELPPCNVCKGAVDLKAVLSCSLCQAVTQMGGTKKLTTYCSSECYRKGHDKHSEQEHDCQGGDKCIQLLDEDTDMNGGMTEAVTCSECVSQKEVAVFCSQRCGAANIAAHRLDKHGVKTAAEEAGGLVSPVKELVETTLAKENPGLAVTPLES